MPRKPRYRTYIVNLWMAIMFCTPLAFLLFTLFADSGMYGDPEEPFLFALFLSIAFLFTVPTVLFIIIASFIIPNISKKPDTLKRVTVVTLLLGVLATFLVVWQAGPYSGEQVSWGIVSAILYMGATIGFGWRLKL